MSEERKNICVTQKAIVLREDGKFLAILRGEKAPSHPSVWDLPGGALEYGEDPIVGIAREIKEETGLSVKNLKPFEVSSKENPWGFWVTIAYACEAVSNEVVLSYEHNEFRWVTKDEFLVLPSWEKIISFVNKYERRNQ